MDDTTPFERLQRGRVSFLKGSTEYNEFLDTELEKPEEDISGSHNAGVVPEGTESTEERE